MLLTKLQQVILNGLLAIKLAKLGQILVKSNHRNLLVLFAARVSNE